MPITTMVVVVVIVIVIVVVGVFFVKHWIQSDGKATIHVIVIPHGISSHKRTVETKKKKRKQWKKTKKVQGNVRIVENYLPQSTNYKTHTHNTEHIHPKKKKQRCPKGVLQPIPCTYIQVVCINMVRNS
jgi:hypothetical protein